MRRVALARHTLVGSELGAVHGLVQDLHSQEEGFMKAALLLVIRLQDGLGCLRRRERKGMGWWRAKPPL